MDESQEILVKSLESSGVSIPAGVSSVRDLNPTTLVSVCAQCLNLLDSTVNFATFSPDDSMADQVRICTDIASRIQGLGYIGDMSFHKFLYPSEEDLYKLTRFLVERLSELSEDRRRTEDGLKWSSVGRPEKAENEGEDLCSERVEARLKDLRFETEAPESLNTKAEDASLGGLYEADLVPQTSDQTAVGERFCTSAGDFSKDEPTSVLSGKDLTKVVDAGRDDASENEETAAWKDEALVSGQKETSSGEQLPEQIRYEAEETQNPEKVHAEGLTRRKRLQQLEEELELLREAAEMSFDDEHPVDYYLEQLNEKVDSKKRDLQDLESKWEATRKSLEEKKRSLEDSLYAKSPEDQAKLQKLREVELERQSILSEIKKRDEEHSKLTAELERQPKMASRRSHIERIEEITKNSRKQDADIERILKETRELQLESNSIQERLHRTYAISDEIVFREAKKDPVGRQAYRLLTSIHETFEQISENILATDRVRREVADHEKKLSAMASRSLNIDKLQADLDAIRKENEYLEQRLRG